MSALGVRSALDAGGRPSYRGSYLAKGGFFCFGQIRFCKPRSQTVPNSVTAAVVNFQTPDLLENAVRSFREHYPTTDLLIVDNGSQDESKSLIHELVRELPQNTRTLYLEKNVFHGPAMHRALETISSTYVYFFDSDTITKTGGFLEEMTSQLDSSGAYGIGRKHHVDKRGFPKQDGFPILISYYMMWRVETYKSLPPFEHHGLPVLKNCIDAHHRGEHLLDYPIQDYVDHLGRGTASRFGYSLGWRSRWERLLYKLGF